MSNATGADVVERWIDDREEQRQAPGARSVKRPDPKRRRRLTPRLQSYIVQPSAQMLRGIFAVTVVLALIYGWLISFEPPFSAETGTGYWFGIAGGSMMAMLLAYPLRKRLRAMRSMGSVASWFRIHMLLGIVGPVVILYHANFKLGSLNSSVAMIAMLTVAISGLIGRYLYSKVHIGLYGQRAELREILSDTDELKFLFGPELARAPIIHEVLERYESRVLGDRQGMLSGLVAAISLVAYSHRCRKQLLRQSRRIIHRAGRARGKSWWQRQRRYKRARHHIDLYFAAVGKAVRLAMFERMFAAWHLLHLPLFIILVCAVVVHIIAVHLY